MTRESWKWFLASRRALDRWWLVCENRHRCQEQGEDEQVEFHVAFYIPETKIYVYSYINTK